MDTVFIATNRNAIVDGITEIAAIRATGKVGQFSKKNVVAAFSSHVSDNLKSVLDALEKKLETREQTKFVVVTVNVESTRSALKKDNQQEFFIGRIWIDVSQLVWPLLVNGSISNRNLETLCNHFGVNVTLKADSADDCTMLAQVYCELMRRYTTALTGEEVLRDLGGETLEGLRKIVGF